MSRLASSLSRRFLAAVLAALLCTPAHAQEKPAPPAQPAAEIPRLAPASEGAKPLTVYQWTAQAGATDEHDGLRFTWSLPRDFKESESYDLVVVCHGTGLDYRWGHANLKPEQFRPGSIVVCVDGTSEADDGTRVFLGETRDVLTFKDFVLEMTRAFPTDHIFLYGHSQGSFFVTFVAGRFPGLTEGVVAQSSGAWADINREGGIQSIPLVFMHGTADPVVPYFQSPAARLAFVEAGHQMVLLRRLQGYPHWPNAVRAGESVDWCAGMSTMRPDTALASAEALLKPKPKDENGYEGPVPFGGAERVLRRVTLDAENAVEDPTDAQKARAQALIDRIEAEGARQVELLKKDVKAPGDLILGLGPDGGAWLGYLLAMREDFRGVKSVEKYIEELDLDATSKEQWEAAKRVLDAWYGPGTPRQKFETVSGALGDCFLVDAFPSDLGEKMAELKSKAAELQLSEESLEKYAAVEMWAKAWKNGYAKYLDECKKWK